MDKFHNSQKKTRFQAETSELEKSILKMMHNRFTELKSDLEMEKL